jgi:hypothetical protein
MVKTGGSIFIALSLIVMLLSLLPVRILFARKVSPKATFIFLKILCLFVFFQQITLSFIQPGSLFIQTGFRLAEFALVFYLFKLMMTSNQGKQIMTICLVSLLSVLITIYAIKGITAFSGIITTVQAGILTLLACIILVQLINNRRIEMVNEPVFWITGGLLCYFGMVLFIETLAGYDLNVSQQIQNEKSLVLSLANIIRFAFFAVAAIMAPTDNRPSR